MEPNQNDSYKRARKRVQEMKGFYVHLTVYLLVNLFLLLVQFGLFSVRFEVRPPGWGYFSTPLFWGIGLFFHWLHAFRDTIPFLKSWEERKIRQLMDKEEKEYRDTFKDQ